MALCEVLALEVLHHHERGADVEGADVDHARDVLAADPRGRAGLAREALHEIGIAKRLRQQPLDGHALVELQMFRSHHHAHAAPAEQVLDEEFSRERLAGHGNVTAHGRQVPFGLQTPEQQPALPASPHVP